MEVIEDAAHKIALYLDSIDLIRPCDNKVYTVSVD